MQTTALLLFSLFAAGPQVDVTTLDNEHFKGTLSAMTATAVELQSSDEPLQSIPLANLLEVQFAKSGSSKSAVDTQPFWVNLVDGSELNVEQFQADVRELTTTSPAIGELKIEISQVRSLRLAERDARVEERWAELIDRDHNQDRLVIRKQDVLNFIPGTLGTIDAETIQFELDGRTASVKREKVFGIIFGRRETATTDTTCRVMTHDGGTLSARSLTWNDGQLRFELVAGPTVSLPVETLSALDFSLGKVQYLSQMQPREVKYTPFFDVTWKYQRDANLDGGPLRVGNEQYARGLSIHSKTYLRYRLGTEYRRFRAIVGIDRLVGKQGDVHVVISGDGKVLWDANVRGSDAKPYDLDLDVSAVRELEILVDFGGDLDIADHLDLADARLIK